MGFQRSVPSNAGELMTHLRKMHENRSHVKSVKLNESNGHLEIDLDGMANFAGNPDMYMPIKRARIQQAKELLDRLLRSSNAGYPPSEADGAALFEMIDPMGR